MSGSMGATPRCTQQQLPEFVNRTVRIVGRVAELRGDTATVDAGGLITVHLNQDSYLRPNLACEIIGKVRADQSISVMQATDFGEKFDFAAANAVVRVTHKYPELFTNAQNTTTSSKERQLGVAQKFDDIAPAPEPRHATPDEARGGNSTSTLQERDNAVKRDMCGLSAAFSHELLRPQLPPASSQSLSSDAQLLLDEIKALDIQSSGSPLGKYKDIADDLDQDAQLLADEIDTFERSCNSQSSRPKTFYGSNEGICDKHETCQIRYERFGNDNFEVHELDGEEQWLWIAKPSRSARRRSYI